MPMEGSVNRLSSQKTFGVSAANRVAAKSSTIEVNGEQFFKRKTQLKKKHNMPPYCSCCVIQVSVSPAIQILLENIVLSAAEFVCSASWRLYWGATPYLNVPDITLLFVNPYSLQLHFHNWKENVWKQPWTVVAGQVEDRAGISLPSQME